LKDLDYSVDILTTPEPITGEDQLDPRKYGVIVESGWKKGLLLPDLEGVDTPEQQVNISSQKAGIEPYEPKNSTVSRSEGTNKTQSSKLKVYS